ncbi:quinone-dependent dihydroorotate dehydrogenase [Frateuria aurantia]
MYPLLRSLLFKLDAENAHGLTLKGLDLVHRSGLGGLMTKPPAELPCEVLGLRFPNPVGLAAGLDKNGAHLDALGALGFGFIEIGTITPRPQAGNPKPRLFRLPAHQAIINRMGFNNEGIDALVGHVRRSDYRGVLGINIGKNKDTPNDRAADDYLICLNKAWPLASYITVNISSPNTQGLRDLQEEATLRRFISTLRERQEQLGSQSGGRKPMLLKIAPDLDETELDAIAEVLLSCGVDGVICTNTTIDRSAIAGDPLAGETGGLSGAPVRRRSDQVLAGMAQRLGGRIPMIGVGGITSGADAAHKQALGAPLVQLYSGLIYRGPALIGECVEAMRAGAIHDR